MNNIVKNIDDNKKSSLEGNYILSECKNKPENKFNEYKLMRYEDDLLIPDDYLNMKLSILLQAFGNKYLSGIEPEKKEGLILGKINFDENPIWNSATLKLSDFLEERQNQLISKSLYPNVNKRKFEKNKGIHQGIEFLLNYENEEYEKTMLPVIYKFDSNNIAVINLLYFENSSNPLKNYNKELINNKTIKDFREMIESLTIFYDRRRNMQKMESKEIYSIKN